MENKSANNKIHFSLADLILRQVYFTVSGPKCSHLLNKKVRQVKI